jgi:hypothetical protein
VLQDGGKHEHGEHIEEDMGEVSVHEHICEELRRVEVAGHKEVQPQVLGQVYSISLGNHHSEECEDIDNNQVLCYCWHI